MEDKVAECFWALLSFSTAEEWIARGDRCFSKVQNPCSQLVVSPAGAGHYFHELYNRDVMSAYQPVEFEGRLFPVYSEVDCFLRTRFGEDYMTVPEESDWERHAYVKLDISGAE